MEAVDLVHLELEQKEIIHQFFVLHQQAVEVVQKIMLQLRLMQMEDLAVELEEELLDVVEQVFVVKEMQEDLLDLEEQVEVAVVVVQEQQANLIVQVVQVE